MQPKDQVSGAYQPFCHRGGTYLWRDQGRETPAGDKAHLGKVLEFVRKRSLQQDPSHAAVSSDLPFDEIVNYGINGDGTWCEVEEVVNVSALVA